MVDQKITDRNLERIKRLEDLMTIPVQNDFHYVKVIQNKPYLYTYDKYLGKTVIGENNATAGNNSKFDWRSNGRLNEKYFKQEMKGKIPIKLSHTIVKALTECQQLQKTLDKDFTYRNINKLDDECERKTQRVLTEIDKWEQREQKIQDHFESMKERDKKEREEFERLKQKFG